MEPNIVLLLTGLFGLLLAIGAFFLPEKPLSGKRFSWASLGATAFLGAIALPLAPHPDKALLAGLGLVVGLLFANLHPLPRLGHNPALWLGFLVFFFSLSRGLVVDPVLFSYLALGLTLALATSAFFRKEDGLPATAAMAGILSASMIWGPRLGPLEGVLPLALALLAGLFLLLSLCWGGFWPTVGSLVLTGLSGWLLTHFLFLPFLPFLCGLGLTLLILLVRFLPKPLAPFAIVLLTGASLVLVNRLFGIFGVSLAGIAMLVGIEESEKIEAGVALLSVFVGRVLLQLYLDRIGLNTLGIDLTRVYAFAALALALLIPSGLALPLRDRFLAFAIPMLFLLLPVFVGFFAHLDALAAFLGGLVIAGLVTYREERMPPLLLASTAFSLLLAPWFLSIVNLPRPIRILALFILALSILLCALTYSLRSSCSRRPA